MSMWVYQHWVSSLISSLYILRQSLAEPEAHQFYVSWDACPRDSLVLPPNAGNKDVCHCSQLYVRAEGLNSGSHACLASTLMS